MKVTLFHQRRHRNVRHREVVLRRSSRPDAERRAVAKFERRTNSWTFPTARKSDPALRAKTNRVTNNPVGGQFAAVLPVATCSGSVTAAHTTLARF